MPVVVVSVIVECGIIWVVPEAWLLPIIHNTHVSPTVICNVVRSERHVSTVRCREILAGSISNIGLRSLRSILLILYSVILCSLILCSSKISLMIVPVPLAIGGHSGLRLFIARPRRPGCSGLRHTPASLSSCPSRIPTTRYSGVSPRSMRIPTSLRRSHVATSRIVPRSSHGMAAIPGC